jgi:hypothetical protein
LVKRAGKEVGNPPGDKRGDRQHANRGFVSRRTVFRHAGATFRR